MLIINEIDALIARGGRFRPYWGWHDDHRAADGTPAYKPALQQVRGEFAELLDVLAVELNDHRLGRITGSCCLQLGLGETTASHEVWRCVFDHAVTLDWGGVYVDDARHEGTDIATSDAVQIAALYAAYRGPYDLLFVDAGHLTEDVRRDHANYGPMVRPGGLIVFHDALRRPGFEEAVQVWRYLETLREPVRVIGSEVGVAWIRRE